MNKIAWLIKNDEKNTEEIDRYSYASCVVSLCEKTETMESLSSYFDDDLYREILLIDKSDNETSSKQLTQKRCTNAFNNVIYQQITKSYASREELGSYNNLLLFQCVIRIFFSDDPIDTVAKVDSVCSNSLQRFLLKKIITTILKWKDDAKDEKYVREKVSSARKMISSGIRDDYLLNEELTNLHSLISLRHLKELDEMSQRNIKRGDDLSEGIYSEDVEDISPFLLDGSVNVLIRDATRIISCVDCDALVDLVPDLSVVYRLEDSYILSSFTTKKGYDIPILII